MSDVAAEIKVGDTSPDFNLKDQDQKDVKLSDYRGKKTDWGGHGHQVFRVGEDEDVRLGSVLIDRKSPVGLPRDGRERQRPTEAERSVSAAGIVRARVRAEIRTPGARGQSYQHRGRTGHG